jgi:3-phosphoshikimate 1-carboxyvinyltransferase
MKKLTIYPSKGNGSLLLPPSKSHTQRAFLFALMAQGICIIKNPLISPDTEAMLSCIEMLGAKIVHKDIKEIHIKGCAGHLCNPSNILDAGNSGLVLRFIGAFLSFLPNYTVITGDYSIRSNRPAAALIEGIRQLGGFAESLPQNDLAPILIKGPIAPGSIQIDGSCSQAASAFLIACSFLSSPTTITLKNAGEKPFLQMTLSWLDFLGLRYTEKNLEEFTVLGGGKIDSFEVIIPSDMSSLAFPLAAALVTPSNITFKNLDTSGTQGDAKLISILQNLGAHIGYTPLQKEMNIEGKQSLLGGSLDVNPYIDALPILAVLGCLGKNPLFLTGASIARKKECDRIHCMTQELRKMGAIIEEKEDGMVLFPSSLRGTTLSSHKDHRVAMALTVAALAAEGESTIEDTECIEKTYPHFADDLASLGFLAAEK